MHKAVLIAAAAVISFCLVAAVSAEEKGLFDEAGISITGDIAYYSDYVWRGFLLDGDAVVQPGIYIAGPETAFGTLTAKFWSSHDLNNSDSRASEEYDYILDYTFGFNDIDVSFGHTYYDFPGTDSFSREFYAGIALPNVFLSPSLCVYRDYGRPEDGGGQGTYTVLNAAYSVPLTVARYACSLDLSGHYGYNHELFINGKGADIGLQAGFAVPLTKNSSLVPNVNYSIALGDLKKETDGNQKKRMFAGLALQFSL